MMKAVHELRDRGILSARQRGGIRVEPAPTEPTAHVADGLPLPRRWRALYGRLSHDIVSGRFAPGSALPLGKILASQYATSPRTLRRALAALVHDGVIETCGRGYRVCQYRPAGDADRVVLIARGESALQLMDISERTFAMLRALEEECMRSHVELAIVPCYYVDNRIVGLEQAGHLCGSASTRSSVLGVMAWTAGLPVESVPDLRAFLQRTTQPVALLNDSAEPEWQTFRALPHVRVYSQAFSVRAGEVAGRFLRELGHRRVAFVHTHGQSAFAQRRLAGLRAAFAPLGQGARVESVLFRERPHAPDALDRLLGDVSARLGQHLRDDPALTVRHNAVEYGYLARIDLATSVLQQHRQSRKSLFRDLEGILAEHAATAWVAANDRIALDCLDFLQSKGIRVPEDISVMGFDNGQLALVHGLTSCDFSGGAYVHAMVEYLLRPGRGSRPTAAKPSLEIDPFIVKRRTTGPAKHDGPGP
jgi:DNA-binding LacI/PurR family transcriptional regulator